MRPLGATENEFAPPCRLILDIPHWLLREKIRKKALRSVLGRAEAPERIDVLLPPGHLWKSKKLGKGTERNLMPREGLDHPELTTTQKRGRQVHTQDPAKQCMPKSKDSSKQQ